MVFQQAHVRLVLGALNQEKLHNRLITKYTLTIKASYLAQKNLKLSYHYLTNRLFTYTTKVVTLL